MKAKNWRAPERPYTRADYIHGAPQPRIAKYTMGRYSDDYEYELLLIAKEDLQMRDVALESARIALSKHLSSVLGNENYFAELKAHPHHVLRENKMIFGAHADRLQEGMRRAFGKPVGRAARIKRNSPVFRVLVNEPGLQAAKRALELASKKLPKSYRIEIRKLASKEAS
ncbi:MAG: 50S ribosomal protein L16 [Thaumarchaeota archaeon]|nr:50S ribosomal protein L16 [Nitrososphaerota archaeon]